MILRPAEKNDILTLAELELLTQFSPWSEEIFHHCFHLQYPTFVIDIDNKPIGFTTLSSLSAGECHILNLVIHPLYQSQGYGKQLLLHALIYAKTLGATMAYLEVRRSNAKAIALYQKIGFVQISERKNYYPAINGKEDALVFSIHL